MDNDVNNTNTLSWLFPIINGKVSNGFNKILKDIFKENNTELNPEQWAVLAYLWKNNGVTQQELCQNTYRDKPSMTRLVDSLESLKLVNRKVLENDRRANHIYLTNKGREIEGISNKLVEKSLGLITKDISSEDMSKAKIVLEKIIDNMNSHIGQI